VFSDHYAVHKIIKYVQIHLCKQIEVRCWKCIEKVDVLKVMISVSLKFELIIRIVMSREIYGCGLHSWV